MKLFLRVLTVVSLLPSTSLIAGPPQTPYDGHRFGILRVASFEAARGQAETWLREMGKSDVATTMAFEVIWSYGERTVLDRVADTLALGDPEAARLLAIATDFHAPAPTNTPDAFRDPAKPIFYRANLALAYAKALSLRRIYEEALEALAAVSVEQVVDPNAYLFHRAVADFALGHKQQAARTIARLLEDGADTPERYRTVAAMMAHDLESWRPKDLGDISRTMDSIERRLELARGGPRTQKLQREVVARLDELIKQVENQRNGSGQGNAGGCPDGGLPPGGGQPSAPQPDSRGGIDSGPGRVDPKRLKGLAQEWGKLPEGERIRAMQEITRDMPPKYREVIETYFRKLSQSQPGADK